MPELTDELYCSEQICIPPTFPYLLRQFAKAAIRTQPDDLLNWSTTYFRCLSLNIPPPVKSRLEHPLPKDYIGLTPGWLKTLYRQFGNTQTATFRLLYDRWNGACFLYDDLIKILCLGKFDNNEQIPITRFLSLCAGYLCDNLTKTMILICEIFTEEPDGGAAMITKHLFLDCYQFLATQIDASERQIVRNHLFLEKFLIEQEKKEEKDKEFEVVGAESRDGSHWEVADDRISLTGDHQITALDYLQLVSESQATIRPTEEAKDKTDTTSCSIDEELPNDVDDYLENIEITGETVEEQQQQPQKQEEIYHEEEDKTQPSARDELAKSETVKSDEQHSTDIDITPEFEDIEIDAVPGIGPIVPQKLAEAVCKYFNKMSKLQNGMVMPRNIRHYECPPLEIIKK